MKLQNITDINGTFDVVNECKGTVELVTADGDVLNLKLELLPVRFPCPAFSTMRHTSKNWI